LPPAQQKPWRAVAVRQYSALLTAGRKGAGRTGNVAVRQSSLTSPVLQCDPPRTASGAPPPRARRAGRGGGPGTGTGTGRGGTAGVRSGAVVSSASVLLASPPPPSSPALLAPAGEEQLKQTTVSRTYERTPGRLGLIPAAIMAACHTTHTGIDVPTPSFVFLLQEAGAGLHRFFLKKNSLFLSIKNS
jgi:hypothetical protein